MKVSVIVPTFNRARILDKCLMALTGQNAEVLVIDDGSEDETKSVAKKYKVRYFCQEHKGPAVARNLAIEKSKGEVLIFINDDTLVESDFVTRHMNFHKKNRRLGVAVVGKMTVDKRLTKSKIMKWLDGVSGMHFGYGDFESDQEIDWGYFWTCNISVKKKFLLKNDLRFDESFPGAAWEDYEFGYRAYQKGLKIYFDKNLSTRHFHCFDYSDLEKRYFAHGQGLYCLRKKLPRKVLPWLARDEIRWLARCLVLMIPKNNKVNNLSMQIMAIKKKLEGFDSQNYYGRGWSFWWLRALVNRRLLGLLKKGDKVLDWGCGDGGMLNYLKKNGFNVWGNDMSLVGTLPNFCQGKLMDCGYESKYFDLVCGLHVIEHVKTPVKYLKEIKRIMKPSGYLYLRLPDAGSWEAKVFGKNWFHRDEKFHRNQLDKKKISQLMIESGFDEFEIYPALFEYRQVLLYSILGMMGVKQIGKLTRLILLPLQVVFVPISLLLALAGQSGTIEVVAKND